MAEESSSYLLVISATLGAIVVLNITLNIAKKGFKRDAVKHSFTNPFVALSSLLSNKDSVLNRDGVEGSIEGYENLFDGKHTYYACIVSYRTVSYRTVLSIYLLP